MNKFQFPWLKATLFESGWDKIFAWKPVSTPDYIEKTSWLETVLRRRNPKNGQWEYKKTYPPEEENDLLVDRNAW